MNYKFFKNTEETWDAMLSEIKKAKSSIYWEIYILKDDTNPFYNFFEIIKKKAKEGVKVRLVLDGFANIWYSQMSNKLLEELEKLGVEVLFFNDWFHRIHRKILIIDEDRAFIGGVNVAESYKKWLDLHIFVTGRRIVKRLLSSFARSYYYSGGKNPYLLSLRKNSPFKKTKMWLLEHFPNTGKLRLKKYYQEKIALSKKKIYIVTPWFIPKPWLIEALKKALKRGVSVEVIMPQKAETKILDIANYLFASAFYNSGIKFFLTKEIIHAKAFLVDDKEGLVGSNNIDAQSFEFNVEAGISFKNKDMIEDLKNIIDDWKKESVPYDDSKYKSKWYFRPIEYIVEKLAQILL